MREEELEIAMKIVIVGNGGVGKSSMIQRYCKGVYTNEYKKTIGVDFLERQIEIDSEDIRLMLWDTAGQEEFDAITKSYYRGAQACVLTFSSTDRMSFEAIKNWKLKIENECGTIPTIIVQNKIDQVDQTVVSTDEADLLSKNLACRLIRTSVKEDVNVSSVFRYLATKCFQLMRQYNNLPLELPVISACSPTFIKANDTIVLQSAGKTSRKKAMLKKCRLG